MRSFTNVQDDERKIEKQKTKYMKKLFKITLTALLTAISVSAVADTYYLRVGRQNNPDVAADYKWSDGSNPVNNVCTWTITPMQSGNCFLWLCNGQSTSNILSLPSSYTFADAQGLTNWNQRQDFGGRYMLLIHLKSGDEFTISWNISTHAITIGSSASTYTVSTASEHGTFDPSSAKVTDGGSAVFTFTPEAGYSYASHSVSAGTATVTKDGNTFTVAPTSNCTLTVVCSKKSYTVNTSLTEGSITPTSATVNHGESKTFDVAIPGGKKFDKTATTYSGTAEISYNDKVITLGNVTSAGTLTVVFSSDVTPIVFWEKYPTLGANAVNLYGYLAERYCTEVTAAGFYWSKSPITDKAAAIEYIGSGAAKEYVIPATAFKQPDGTAASLATMENGFSFSAENAALNPSLTEATTIYLVNYLKTNGNMALSDMVALVYEPCYTIESVTLNRNAVSLPAGYKFTFEALARSAGKTPVYEWYLDNVKIEGATSNIYEFTMPDADNHSLRVKVIGDCSSYAEATANITSCTVPEVTLTANPASATPWTTVTITATDADGHIGTGLWSVTPDAELNNGTPTGVTFRAGTPATYTIKYVGISQECTADVRVEAEKEITISADSEDCENPNAN